MMCIRKLRHFRQKSDRVGAAAHLGYLPQTEPVPHCQGAETAPLRLAGKILFCQCDRRKFVVRNYFMHEYRGLGSGSDELLIIPSN